MPRIDKNGITMLPGDVFVCQKSDDKKYIVVLPFNLYSNVEFDLNYHLINGYVKEY